ncbi:NigD1/NigD2 family lipoprotein [Marinilabilia rubra]|uniref:NigD-like C-terminal domain-containing protein n=1 Tax=Marinilabilia rubra TaxID=2162893 RepID=A0A2U2B5L2_9BACT|nr:NigD-like C-terminal domain-containing protein [Marinilabilia rubra]PWD98324.1 hypothetical protein DDZ16_16240 [Marinilabilia rubra]
MRRMFFALIIGALGLFFTGCLDDDNDTTPVQYFELGMTKVGDADQMQVVTDSELTLEFATFPENYEFEADTRVMVKYSVNERGEEGDSYDYLVDVYSIQDVVLKEIIELNEENRDTIGTDQLSINDVWVSGGFLNIDFSFYGTDEVHYFNLVKDPLEQPDSPNEVNLQIRHDARGDDALSRYRGLMSFYLESLQVEGEDSLNLKFPNQGFYAAPFSEIEVDYKYGTTE